jgi:quercetin dioxygenase-like cupin family protein
MTERALTHGRAAVVVLPGEGRVYPCGSMRAVFKADGSETDTGYAIAEWWLDPHSQGPPPHRHTGEDDVFYVIAGTVTFTVDGEDLVAGPGTYVQSSAGGEHTFRNDTDQPAGFLNIQVPGDFEQEMPGISQWFQDRDGEDDDAR